jgi:hypothetical protein
MVDFVFSGNRGYHTPHSNQLVLGLVQSKPDNVQIQIQQGPLIIATANINFENFEEDPFCGLTLQTNPLSMFNVYPLHAFKHEPDDFFQKCGYGRLSLYFALLYSVSTEMTMAIICENPITSYILFVLFRSGMKPQAVDIQTNIEMYFENLSQYEVLHKRIAGFKEFNLFYCKHEEKYGQLVYTIHATETNKNIIVGAIEKWTNERISCVSDEEFMANFWIGPKLHEYHTNAILQEHYPQLTYKNVLTGDIDIY